MKLTQRANTRKQMKAKRGKTRYLGRYQNVNKVGLYIIY